MRIVQDEVFGPVLTVETFRTEEEAVALANDTRYGLAGAVWTGDMNRAERVSRALRMGTVWINDFHPYSRKRPGVDINSRESEGNWGKRDRKNIRNKSIFTKICNLPPCVGSDKKDRREAP